MFQNLQLEIFIIFLLILIIISLIPLIELKYHSDLYENIDAFNKYCLNNDIKLINELDVKETYMWNMSKYILDYDNLSNFFYKKNDSNNMKKEDYYNLNRDVSKITIDNNIIDNIMKIYNYYLYMSLGLFIFLMVFFLNQLFIFASVNEDNDLKICIAGSSNIEIQNCFRYYIYILFVYILLLIIFFSLILKKLTELYADTDAYEYLMLMKEFDILLKENKPENSEIVDIIKMHSKNKINDISYTTINNSMVSTEILKIYNKKTLKKYENNNDYKITLYNFDKMEYYYSDNAKNKIKDKVEDIFRFIYVYILFLIVPLYILSISLQGNYVYLLFIIILLIIFSTSVYNIYNTLQN
jgi:hypothetical protein